MSEDVKLKTQPAPRPPPPPTPTSQGPTTPQFLKRQGAQIAFSSIHNNRLIIQDLYLFAENRQQKRRGKELRRPFLCREVPVEVVSTLLTLALSVALSIGSLDRLSLWLSLHLHSVARP